MSEILTIPVSVGETEKTLEFENEDDVITIRCDGKEICKADWTNNLQPVFVRMMEIWEKSD